VSGLPLRRSEPTPSRRPPGSAIRDQPDPRASMPACAQLNGYKGTSQRRSGDGGQEFRGWTASSWIRIQPAQRPQTRSASGLRPYGASRTRTGDLLGAIQKRDITEPARQADFQLFSSANTPPIPRAYPGVLGIGCAPSPKRRSRRRAAPFMLIAGARLLAEHPPQRSRRRFFSRLRPSRRKAPRLLRSAGGP
jgi:hypothetical protein